MKNRQILNVWHAIFQPVDISWTKEKEGVIAWKREIKQKSDSMKERDRAKERDKAKERNGGR